MQGTPWTVRQPCTAAHLLCSTALAVPRSSRAASPAGSHAIFGTTDMAAFSFWQNLLTYRAQQGLMSHLWWSENRPCMQLRQTL